MVTTYEVYSYLKWLPMVGFGGRREWERLSMALKVGGNNEFTDNTYSWHSWSPDVLQSPEEVYAAFEACNFVGRRISGFKAVSLAYNLREELIEETVYRYACDLSPEELNGVDPHDWHDPAMPHPCIVELDEPFIIIFEGGDRLDMDFSEASSVRMGKNTIPLDVRPGINYNNFHAERFFSCCIGESLLGIHVEVTPELRNFTGSYGMDIDENRDNYIASLDLLLSSGKRLVFKPFFDYSEVWAEDATGKMLTIGLGVVESSVAISPSP